MKNSTHLLVSSFIMIGSAIFIENQVGRMLCGLSGYFAVVMWVICLTIEDLKK